MWFTALLAAAAAQAGASTPPNFLIILLDDVGRDKVQAYGDQPNCQPTPNMDALAAQGVLFRNAWSYQSCSPTRAALLTGRHSDRTGIGSVILGGDGVYTPLALSEVTIPEALPEHTSIALGKWHLLDSGDPATHPIDSGFDAVCGFLGPNDYFSWDWNLNGTVTPRTGYYPTELAAQTIAVLDRVTEPFFVYYCPKFAHAPFHTPPSILHGQGNSTSAVIQHQAMTESIDTIVGRVLAHVDLSTTYVFLVGDNGSPGETVAFPFEAGKVKGSVFEGGLRVPMIVAGPGVARGAECDELVHVTDYFATIRTLSGLPPIGLGAEDSIDFAPLLADPASPGVRDTLYVHKFPFPGTTGQNFRALRTKRWKLIERVTSGGHELYDLSVDPFENDDLLVSQPGPATSAIKNRLLGMMPTFP
ncbi:Arylsulfatase [Planctomycetes bacterium Poly30]|uniref:Arylsulfatase n=1 Tax=Saltatorellus ferox TaxID=2528018 RepID=A0A518ELC4_9BACT|nr:Arylsulfatase [Planctomycetes bacterium Poly30]